MKKFLALVLALVMTMSLVTISSSAAFSDAADIDYVEAVNVLNGLGVIDGMGDGTFSPDGSVTRAQMAKMIAFIGLGVAEATAFEGTKTDLTDVDGHWAEAYIKYCYSQGIIAGKGDGKFDPDANVTTAEAAKMLLVALGWSADVQGYVGEQWKVNTIRDAFKSKVFEGINLAADKALDRDESAKLIYNTVLADTVRQQPTLDVSDGTVGITFIQDSTPLLEKTFNASRYEGPMNAVTYNSAKSLYNYAGTYKEINGTGTPTTFSAEEDYSDLVGEKVVVVEQVVDGKATTLGIYATGDTTVEYAFASSLGTTSGKLKVNGTAYAVDSALSAFQTDVAGDRYVSSYDIVKLTDVDENGKLDTLNTFTYKASKVIYASDSHIITEVGDTLYYADDVIADGIAKDDYVSYTKHVNGVWVVEEIAPFEAIASATKADLASVQFNDSWFNYNGKTFDAGTTYRVWALNGVVVARDQLDGASISNLVMVYAKDQNNIDGNRAAYIDATGAKFTVKIDADNGKSGSEAAKSVDALTVGNLYLINVTDDGVEFTTPVNIGTDYAWVSSGNLDVDSDSTGYYAVGVDTIASNAVIFVKTSDGATILSGTQFKNLSATSTSAVAAASKGYYTNDKVDGKLTRATHVGVATSESTSALNALSGNELYAYITDDSVNTSVNGTKYLRYSIWNGSENLTVLEKSSDNRNTRVKGDVLRYDSIDADGYIKGVTDLNAVSAAVHNDSFSKKIYVSSSTAYDVTGDTKYLYVNSRAASANEIGVPSGVVSEASDFVKGTLKMPNIAYALVNSDDLEIVVVDVANSMERADSKIKLDSSCKTYTDSVWVIQGDAITFDFGTATKSVSGVVDAEGNAVSDKTGKITVFALGYGNPIVVS